MDAILKMLKSAADLAHKSAPYLLVELVLPGGTLFALLLFLHRNRSRARRYPGALAAVFEQTLGTVGGALARPHGEASIPRAANDDGLAPLAMAPVR